MNTKVKPVCSVKNSGDETRRQAAVFNPANYIDRTTMKELGKTPLVSVLVIYRGGARNSMLSSVDSILKQEYTQWELCVASTLDNQKDLTKISELPNTHLIVSIDNEKSLVKAAFEKSNGELIIFLTPGDILMPNAFMELVKAVNDNGNCNLAFGDEIVLAGNGEHIPILKPGFGMETLLSYNSIGRPMIMSRELYMSSGGLKGLGPCDEYDFTLRSAKNSARVVHVPKIILARENAEEKVDPVSGRKCVEKILKDRLKSVYVTSGLYPGSFHARFSQSRRKRLSIIIPVLNAYEPLRRCLESVDDNTVYDEYEFIIADMGSKDVRLTKYYSILDKNKAARIIPSESLISMPEALNGAASKIHSDTLLFLSPYCELLTPDAFELIIEQATRKGIGAIGPKLVDGQGNIISAGMVIGLGGWADSPYRGQPDGLGGQSKNRFINTIRNVTAVSAYCMAINSETFFNIGCFDTTFKSIGYDMDLCIRLYRHNFHSVFMPFARFLYHGELMSYKDADKDDLIRCYDSYRTMLSHGDPFYNPNYEYSSLIPVMTGNPYPAIQLNPNYKE